MHQGMGYIMHEFWGDAKQFRNHTVVGNLPFTLQLATKEFNQTCRLKNIAKAKLLLSKNIHLTDI